MKSKWPSPTSMNTPLMSHGPLLADELQNSSTFLIRLRLSSTATDKGKHQSVTPVSTTNLRSYAINSKACLRLCMWVLELCVCVFLYFSSPCRRAGQQKKQTKSKRVATRTCEIHLTETDGHQLSLCKAHLPKFTRYRLEEKSLSKGAESGM